MATELAAGNGRSDFLLGITRRPPTVHELHRKFEVLASVECPQCAADLRPVLTPYGVRATCESCATRWTRLPTDDGWVNEHFSPMSDNGQRERPNSPEAVDGNADAT